MNIVYIIIGIALYRLIGFIFRTDKYRGIIGASKDPVVMNGINNMNDTMELWEARYGVEFPRFRLLDWFLPGVAKRKHKLVSRQVSKFVKDF
tara:strand:- start:102 stop:377 length:276 start_codon:yes stop_codon:yes gene_type:complete